ncbi:alpha/beta-hydrolase [Linderina pennispora]|uniref:Carboxypeptidase n=1 Tax=Linderina pennispora TaxID=61395 RepID=A0A1Y1WC86_9FUNG|nr:alpha/beta-hydrolase [Linderina pennispora]ORX71153.1 alpha/beta-hydrolase [Linderina pennispora]
MRVRIASKAATALLLALVSTAATAPSQDKHTNDRVAGLPYKAGEQPLHESYAGHITVRQFTPDSGAENSGTAKLFYWYFPAIAPKVEKPPLALWIQGGPGSSSMIGLFTEMGPLELTDDGQFTRRNITWANEYNFLVVDQPVGTGFSSSGDFRDGYVTNMRAVGKDMWKFMQEFYALRPELREHEFFVFSESYGGKFVPAIGVYFDEQNQKLGEGHLERINLKGLSIGNSWVHPPLQILAHGGIGFAWGLLDANQADTVDLLAFKALNHTMLGDLARGTDARNLMFDYFKNVTGGINWYDIRQRNHQYKRTYLDRGLNQPVVRKALHSEDIAYGKDWGVYYHLMEDIMRTTAPLFPYLLERMPVNLNQGQFDFRDGVAGNTLWINELEWTNKHKFALADRDQWWIGNELSGYMRQGGGLSHWVILNAGHMSPGDQPEACLNMVNRIIKG